MVTIRPATPDDIPAVKDVIYSVAYSIFGFDGTLEDSIRHYEAQGVLEELKDIQGNYFANGGIFLVAVDDEGIVGSGALRVLDEGTAELKRMWLLEAYHGQGIGYRLLTRLFDFARARGYTRVRLQTSPGQTRAIDFYRRVGFYQIPSYNEDEDEVSMEIELNKMPF